MVVVVGFEVMYLALVLPIERAFGYLLYHRIGGNMKLRHTYKLASVFFSLVKLDLFVMLLLVVMAGLLLFGMSVQTFINAAAFVLSLAWASIGARGVRRESMRAMYVFFSFALVSPLYIVYTLADMHSHPDDYSVDVSFGQFLVTGSIACVVRVCLLVNAVWTTNNFGQGLKEHYFDKIDSEPEAERAPTTTVAPAPRAPERDNAANINGGTGSDDSSDGLRTKLLGNV